MRSGWEEGRWWKNTGLESAISPETYHKSFICSWSSTWWCAFCGLLSALFKWLLPLSHGRSGILSGRWWRRTANKLGMFVLVMTQMKPLLLVRKAAGCSGSLGIQERMRFITLKKGGDSQMNRTGLFVEYLEKPLRGAKILLVGVALHFVHPKKYQF